MRGFTGIDLAVDAVPDETTILNFRHWLERHALSRSLFDEVGAMLEERGLLMRQGTIVDATIIAAPPSTKNKQQSRDPEMHQTKKGNQWHFGMTAHIGVDVASGLVHTVKGSAANQADITQTAALLHGQEEDVFGDAGYSGADKRPELEDRDVSWNIAIKRSIIKNLPKALRDLAEPVERALAGARRSRASLPHHQEPFPPQEAALSRPQEEHRTAIHAVRVGQSGHRQTGATRPTGGITPEICRDAITAHETQAERL